GANAVVSAWPHPVQGLAAGAVAELRFTQHHIGGSSVIPAVDRHTGLLPTTPDRSPHAATVDEVYQTFVVGAPHRGRRQLIWDAFSIYSQLLWGYFPDAQLWLNGGFVTHKRDEPHDLDIAFLVPTSELEIVF